MKMNPMLLLGICVTLACVVAAPCAIAGEKEKLYEEAQRAYISGRIEEAQTKFELLLQMDPQNLRAQNYLRMIQIANKQAGGTMEKQLAGIVLPKVEFHDATFGSALEYVRQEVSRITDKKTAVSFVLQIPDAAKEAPITLSLATIPVTELLRYMGELAKVEFRYEQHAVVVRPIGAARSEAKPSEANAKPGT